MELTIEKTVQETVNIEFPHYTKSHSTHYFKFENEKICVKVSIGFRMESFTIERMDCFPESWMLDTPSTAEEFNEAFELVREKINKLQ